MKSTTLWTVCRICLQEGELLNIFENDEQDIICDKIMICSGLEIKREPDLPESICQKCNTNLNIAYQFRELCLESNATLQAFLSNRSKGDIQDSGIIKEELHEMEEDYIQIKLDDNNMFCESDSGESADEIAKEEGEGQTEEIDVNDFVEEAIPQTKHAEIDPETMIKKKRDRKKRHATTTIQSENIIQVSEGLQYEVFVSEDQQQEVSEKRKPGRKKDKSLKMCEICGNTFQYRHSLFTHMRIHKKENLYTCEICGKSFGINSSQLTRHMRTHTGARPYTCSYCGRSFSDSTPLNRHIRTHTGERPFKCETCGKTFTYSSVLTKHMLIHTGEKPYECIPCSKRFSNSHHLKEHLKTLKHKSNSAVIVLSEDNEVNNKIV